MIAPRSPSRGYALIEMVLAIGAVAIVLGLCAGLLHVLFRLDRTGRDHLVETAAIDRLARQFRHDVHAAREARAAAGPHGPAARLDLTLPEDRTVVYERAERSVARIEHHGATLERRESYTLPFCSDSRFLVQSNEGQTWVRLELKRETAHAKDAIPANLRHDLQIEALAGKDLRRLFTGLEPAKEVRR